jgi:hypothetical protein
MKIRISQDNKNGKSISITKFNRRERGRGREEELKIDKYIAKKVKELPYTEK